MDIYGFNPGDMLSFLLTLFRISIVLFLLPFYGADSTPKTVKAALTFVVTAALWPKLSFPAELFPANGADIAIMILGEFIIGLVMGLLVNILFAAVQFGGQIIGFQMGFSMVNVVDPVTGASNSATAHFLYMCTMLTFLVLNGHLMLLSAVGMSFEAVPPGSLLITNGLANHILEFSNLMFVLAVKIAAPVMASIFLVDLSLALISRAAPQMHVLILGFPVKISVGFFILGFVFSIMTIYVQDFLQQLGPLYESVLKLMGPQGS